MDAQVSQGATSNGQKFEAGDENIISEKLKKILCMTATSVCLFACSAPTEYQLLKAVEVGNTEDTNLANPNNLSSRIIFWSSCGPRTLRK